MKRRRLLLGAGTLLGASAGLGTSAFTSVSAKRSVSVATAGDDAAFLGLEPTDGPNGTFASMRDGQLRIDLAETDAGGKGLGTDSVYEFDDVFRVTNRGTQPIYVWATFADADDSAFDLGGSNPDVYLYPNGDSGDVLRDSEDQTLYLPVGESAAVGLHVDTHGVETGEFDLTATIHADAAKPNASDAVGGDGTTIPGPTNGLVGYWPLDTVEDGVAEDIVGGSDGSIPDGVTAATGQTGKAARFPATDSFVKTTPQPGVDAPFTLAVWLNAAGFDQTKYPLAVSKWQRAQNRDYLIGYHGPEGRLYTQFNREPGGNKNTLFGPEPETGVWYHCVLTYDETSQGRFYVDGSHFGSSEGPFGTSNSQFVIGSKDGGGNSWHGRIDDVRLYDRVLSSTEVSALYDATQ